MEIALFKKINLLLHLAKVDGKFDRAERNLLIAMLKEKNLDETYIETHKYENVDLESVTELPDQVELFYWILKMIKADNYLHPIEMAYAKILALKLNFKTEAVDFYSDRQIPSWDVFASEVRSFQHRSTKSKLKH